MMKKIIFLKMLMTILSQMMILIKMKKNDFINNDGDLIIKIDDKYLNKNKFINKINYFNFENKKLICK